MGPDRTIKIKPSERLIRVLMPNREGTVDITLGLETAEGHDRIQVDVQSDSPRYGPDDHGRTWGVDNGRSPGVVLLTSGQDDSNHPTCHECGARAEFTSNGDKLCAHDAAMRAVNGNDIRLI